MFSVKKGKAASYDVIGSMERICYYIYGPRRCGMSTLIRDLLLTIDRQATYQIATIDDEIQSDADVLFIESNAPPIDMMDGQRMILIDPTIMDGRRMILIDALAWRQPPYH